MINIPDITELTQPSGIFHVDYINSLNLSEIISISDCSFLNIRGWAIDNKNKTSVGGIIALINGKSYASQFVLSRNDLARKFDNKELEYAGWGIKIPCSDFKYGLHDLTFQVLNAQQNKYWVPQKKFTIKFEKKYTLSDLKELKHTKEQTKYSIDNINETSIGTSTAEVIIDKELLQIHGWAVDFPNGKLASQVLIEINGELYNTNYGIERADVMNAYKNDSFLNSGWKVVIPISNLVKGKYNIGLKIIANDKKSYYQQTNYIPIKII